MTSHRSNVPQWSMASHFFGSSYVVCIKSSRYGCVLWVSVVWIRLSRLFISVECLPLAKAL